MKPEIQSGPSPAAPVRPASPSLESLASIREDGSHVRLHPADVTGRFMRLRRWSGWILILVYVSLPWIPIRGYPAVFLDVLNRRFHLFGWTLAAQDLWLLFFLISGVGFGLFYVTALLGRVWCGWACPQTVFLEHVYRRLERWIEGDAVARRRLDAAPWTAGKFIRRAGKHGAFIVVSLVITHLFLAYFVSLPQLWAMMREAPVDHWSAFVFVFVFAGVLYFNFAWFREQLCIVLCPYGRLQSALIDDHSLVIGYDARRGEPRGRSRRKPCRAGSPAVSPSNRPDPATVSASGMADVAPGGARFGDPGHIAGPASVAPGAAVGAMSGDCIDCHRCVAVCPTGIDIRQGLQIECIGCAACIDACDAVMTRLQRPTGLIRYDSLSGLAGGVTRWLRPRTIVYSLLLLAGAAATVGALSTVRPAAFSVTRLVGAAYYLDPANVRNQFLVRLVNKREGPERLLVRLRGAPAGVRQAGLEDPVQIAGMDEEVSPLVVVVPRGRYTGPFTFTVVVRDAAGRFELTRDVEFLGPDPRLLHEEDKDAAHERTGAQ